MRIIHLSYARARTYDNPEAWLARLSFFTVMLERSAAFAEVISIHLINSCGLIKRNGVEYHFLNKHWWGTMLPIQIHTHIKKLYPDVVIVHGLVFPFQVLLLRVQLGSGVKVAMIHHAEKPLRFHKRIFQKRIDTFIDAYFFNSIECGKLWHEKGLIKEIAKIHETMIGSSIFYPFDRTLSKNKTKVNGSRIYLWVGHLGANKDPVTLVKAFQVFSRTQPDAQLYLIYQEEDLLEEIVALKGSSDQVVLVGRVPHAELLYWYNSADFIVSTSHAEGGGTAVCEGMSCGCFPILTNIPSFRMMTDQGKTGFLFEAGSVQALTEALANSVYLDLDEERRKVLAHFRCRLSAEAVARQMMDIFESL